MGLRDNIYSSASAVGKRDWDRVIQLEKESLIDDPDNQHAYSMMGLAYRKKKEIGNAKKCYAKALAIDGQCVSAIQELAEIYAVEKNHEIAYSYVLKGLYSVEEVDHRVPKFIKFAVSLALKIVRPTVPFKKLHVSTMAMDQSRNQWKEWAKKYQYWYEKNHKDSEKPNVH